MGEIELGEGRRFLTVKEAAERLGFPESMLRRWIRDGAIPCLRLGRRSVRIPAEWVEATQARLDQILQRGSSPDEFIARLTGRVKSGKPSKEEVA